QRAFKVLVVMDYDFRQILLPPLVAFVAPIDGQTLNIGAALGWVKRNRVLRSDPLQKDLKGKQNARP
ncbi:MAG TPA: hypothetical protein VNO75_10910, partial [Gemmatimonadaceae bacterium]|nr:hypothetical protein [Gemmatimonadaceae bacterium]